MENEIVNLAAMEGSVDFSMFSMFFKSDWIVKFVIILLILFSIQSWKIIVQKIFIINKMKRISKKFENHFWSGVTLDELHQQIDNFEEESFSITFKNVMDEYEKSLESKTKTDSSFIQRLETVLELSVSNEDSKLNKGLSFLASSGSVAPFIGLFGTVWGIMHSFQAIAIAQNTNLAVVAPGIAEALFVTALGLFVAIPSTAFYNLITAKIDIYLSEVENFGKDLVNIISRQIN
jgi:biopolymer transport protein TolQ